MDAPSDQPDGSSSEAPPVDLVLRRSRRVTELAQAHKDAVLERDEALRAAAAAGVRVVDLAEAARITKGRVSQILKAQVQR
jgi:hypothetical protein